MQIRYVLTYSLLYTYIVGVDYACLYKVANAKIMNKGTGMNILAQLDMTANEYNLVTTVYFVRFFPPFPIGRKPLT